jgi:hypothetical protein
MRARISQSATEMICLKVAGGDHNPSLQRMDKREIRFNGQMYDVVREIDKGDVKLFFCIPDTKEDQLYAGLKRINHNKQRLNLWDHMVKIALPENVMNLQHISSESISFPHIQISLYSALVPTWSPPPERS